MNPRHPKTSAIMQSPPREARVFRFEKPVPYPLAERLQERLLQARISGRAPDTVLFLQHEPVITFGTRGKEAHLLRPRDQLAAAGVLVVRCGRGGDVTYHGPGQLVMYPVLRLGDREADAHGYLRNLEEIAIRTAADFGVNAFRRTGLTGAWTDRGKLAAIGVRLRRWVTFHGMSFNVDVDLEGFNLIVPCGLKGEPVTSLRKILGPRCPPIAAVRGRMAAHFEDVCGRRLGRPRPGEPLLAGL